jgi:hypothetical protein
MAVLLLATAAPALADVPTPTPAPTPSDSVLMRRPLDLAKGTGSTPTSTPTPTPGGTPTPTPGSGSTPTSTPTSTTVPGSSYNPDIVTPVTDPGSSPIGVAQWVAGPWQGSGQCGQQATYTRDVSCVVQAPSGGISIPVISMAEPDGRVMQASYAPGFGPQGALSDGVYDPASSDVKMHLAQFGGGDGGGLKTTTMPAQYCLDNGAGPPPANTYTGTQGGCDYHSEEDPGSADWQLPPGASGSVTCSAQAYRLPTYSCYDDDDNKVDLGFCVENIRAGGARNDDLVEPQYGNYSGCKAGWVGYGTDNLCYKPTQVAGYVQPGEKVVDGPDHYAYYRYKCMRSDGTELTGVDAAACTGPQPSNEWRVVGSCSKAYYASGTAHCVLGDNDEYLLGKIAQKDDGYGVGGGSKMCEDNHAACCGQRIASNYDKDDGQYQIVASSKPPVTGWGYYFDEVNMRRDKTSEGVLSLWYGASEGQYQENPYTIPPTDDPDGVLDDSSDSPSLGNLPS